jgi:hypothetical protein
MIYPDLPYLLSLENWREHPWLNTLGWAIGQQLRTKFAICISCISWKDSHWAFSTYGVSCSDCITSHFSGDGILELGAWSLWQIEVLAVVRQRKCLFGTKSKCWITRMVVDIVEEFISASISQDYSSWPYHGRE